MSSRIIPRNQLATTPKEILKEHIRLYTPMSNDKELFPNVRIHYKAYLQQLDNELERREIHN